MGFGQKTLFFFGGEAPKEKKFVLYQGVFVRREIWNVQYGWHVKSFKRFIMDGVLVFRRIKKS